MRDYSMSGPPKKPGKSADLRSNPHEVLESSSQIALKLRALYNSVEMQPLPDIFLDLLEKLDQAEKLDEPKV
ncbi:NepR family anti-sigma factor [Rhizobium sp. 32-5/1]|uniref:NepR family anti-sigma factor n=1 Tax=Rhizobium sp. 32-5/1 TaxID=3019602 RepID=UPI0032B76F41